MSWVIAAVVAVALAAAAAARAVARTPPPESGPVPLVIPTEEPRT